VRYAFGEFELDVARQELFHDGLVRRLPQRLFDTLYLLIANSDRAISKEEFVEKVWHGRAVTDDSISAAIKDVRRLLGDDGTAQSYVRTQHGFGFRWMADTKLRHDANTVVPISDPGRPGEPRLDVEDAEGGRPSIAVLPFRDFGQDGEAGLLGDAIPAELIAEMARMRWIRVTARGSSFRFREADPDPAVVGQMLNVRYALTGVKRHPDLRDKATPSLTICVAQS
jgi:DNA-binding winged helix-turn-helix (wHTH) protein